MYGCRFGQASAWRIFVPDCRGFIGPFLVSDRRIIGICLFIFNRRLFADLGVFSSQLVDAGMRRRRFRRAPGLEAYYALLDCDGIQRRRNDRPFANAQGSSRCHLWLDQVRCYRPVLLRAEA